MLKKPLKTLNTIINSAVPIVTPEILINVSVLISETRFLENKYLLAIKEDGFNVNMN